MALNRAKIHFDNIFLNYDPKYEGLRPIGPYLVYQLGELSGEPGYYVEKHEQFVHEITFVLSGCGSFIINDRQYEVKKGDLIINRIGETHEILSSKEAPIRFAYIGFRFKDEIQGPIAQIKEFIENPSHCIANVGYNYPFIQSAFSNLFSEILLKDFFSEVMIESYIHQILGLTYRTFSQKKFIKYITSESADQKLVYDIVNYIDTKVESIERLSDLCDVFGYSYTYLAQKFKSIMGESLKTYLNKQRFNKAIENLQRGRNVTEVSEEMGYQSIHAFSRAFKKFVGMSPSEYKKWVEENKNF
ncbi:MAG TPA: AraC family transcriptional regulator [Clostridiales bacterium]|nr:AraC family transcriptional regulator [Clostridiales bacterium]